MLTINHQQQKQRRIEMKIDWKKIEEEYKKSDEYKKMQAEIERLKVIKSIFENDGRIKIVKIH